MNAQQLRAIQSQGLPGNIIPVTIGELIQHNLKYVFYGAAIALLVYMVLGGLQLMTSRGDPKAIQGAQAKITNALIGFMIILFSTIIVSILGSVFGITIFTNIFG